MGNSVQLRFTRNRSSRVSRAAPRGRNGCQTKRDVPRWVTAKRGKLGSGGFTLKVSVEFGIFGCCMAIRDLQGLWCVTELLDKELRKADHVQVAADCHGDINHIVCSTLLIATLSVCKKRLKRFLRNGISLGCSSCPGPNTIVGLR